MLSTVRLSPTRINGDDEVEGSEEAVDSGSVDSQVPTAVAVKKGKKGRRKKDDDWYVGNLYFKLASIISHLFRYSNFIFSQSVHSFNHSTSVHDKIMHILMQNLPPLTSSTLNPDISGLETGVYVDR